MPHSQATSEDVYGHLYEVESVHTNEQIEAWPDQVGEPEPRLWAAFPYPVRDIKIVKPRWMLEWAGWLLGSMGRMA